MRPRTSPYSSTQIPIERQDGSPVQKWKCSRCIIEYTSPEPHPKCPLCATEVKLEQMREGLQNQTAKIELLEKQLRDLDGQVNVQGNFKTSIELLDDADRVFLKTVLYQWRQDRSVSLKVIHSNGKPTGFIADYRHGEPEGHSCSSIGGASLAAYYEEALRVIGSAQAMQLLLRAASGLLPGVMQ